MTVHNSMGVVGKDPGTGAAVPLVTPANVRAGLSAFVRSRSGSTQPYTGKLKGGVGGNLAVAAGSGWTYTVEPGALVVGLTPSRGADIIVSDSVITLGTDPSPSSGSRYDVVYAVQKDAFDLSNDVTQALIDVAKGVVASSGTPTMPDIPNNAQVLATNLMQSTATSTASTGNTITNSMGFTGLVGGVGWYQTLAEMQADASRDRGMLGFLAADSHVYLKTNSSSGTGAAEIALATWDDLPRVRTRVKASASDGGGIWNSGNGTILSTSVTVPAGRRGILRAHHGFQSYLASGTYAGNIYIQVDGTNIQDRRFHNQGRSNSWLGNYVHENGFELGPGTHSIVLYRGVDSASASFEAWFIRGEIVVEW